MKSSIAHDNDSREFLKKDFLIKSGWADAEISPINGDASSRSYERLERPDSGAKLILMDAPPDSNDINPFIEVAQILESRQHKVPSIVACDNDKGFLLLEDFGDNSFTAALANNPECEEIIYHAAIDVLLKVRGQGIDDNLKDYDIKTQKKEVELFGEWLLPLIFGENKAKILAREFVNIWLDMANLVPQSPEVLVHRDFHVDNLFWFDSNDSNQKVGMIDFQDALKGRAAYDLVSILEDARRDVSADVVKSCLEKYINSANLNKDDFMLEYSYFGMQRNAKILGIFTRLYLRDGKESYLNFMPRVWQLFLEDIKHPAFSRMNLWIHDNVADIISEYCNNPNKFKEI